MGRSGNDDLAHALTVNKFWVQSQPTLVPNVQYIVAGTYKLPKVVKEHPTAHNGTV